MYLLGRGPVLGLRICRAQRMRTAQLRKRQNNKRETRERDVIKVVDFEGPPVAAPGTVTLLGLPATS